MDRTSSATRAYGLIMERFSRTAIACFFLLFVVQVNGFSKYGRTCRDIGCRSTERCEMIDKCETETGKCGYPHCVRDNNAKITCATKICPGGQRCITEYGEPKCVNDKPIIGYDSAGVSIVNGQPTSNNNNNNNNHGSVSTNTNPYANANAPPPVDEPGRNYPVSSGTNHGYPPYPPSSTNNNNNGYPGSYSPSTGSSSSSGTNLGYPPYPTQNRMPMPGQTGVYQQPPPQAGGFYPGNSASGYPPYPTNNQQYPAHSNYPYQTRNYNSNAHYPRYRSSSPRNSVGRVINVVLAFLSLVVVTNYIS